MQQNHDGMAQGALTINILSPEATVYEGTAEAVFLPGSLCPFEVLRNHAPIISSLEKGKIRIRRADGTETSFDVEGGFARVKDNVVTVCIE